MKFIETKIYTSKEGLEPLTSVLMQLGLSDFVIEDPAELKELLNKKHPYDWDYIDEKVLSLANKETSIVLYLEDTEEGKKKLQQIKLAAMDLKDKEMDGLFGNSVSFGRLYVEEHLVDNAEWENKWKEYYKPVKVSEGLAIKPTWLEYEAKPEEMVIDLDPGMAFGTGVHPTTFMCLRFLEQRAGQFSSTIDVGCGSGILSIASAIMGAKEVLGIEMDPQAILIAKENVKRNRQEGRVQILEGDLLRGVERKADVVVANLMANLVMLLAEDAAKHLNPSGLFISSGILVEKLPEVKAAIREAGFEIVDITEEEEWCAVLARLKKKSS